jgi:hypothetical protein
MWINGWRMLTVSMVSFVILGCVEKGMSSDLEKRVDGLVTAELQAKQIPGIAVGIFQCCFAICSSLILRLYS